MRPVQIGEVLTIPEEHYLYGQGELRMQVTYAPSSFPPGTEWLQIRGLRLGWQDRVIGAVEIFVRVAALASGAVRREPPGGSGFPRSVVR